jgi:hypothetical protein
MRDWKYKVNIKQYIGKDGLTVQEVAKGVLKEIAKISSKRAFKDDDELSQIVEEFQGIADSKEATVEEFDEILDRFYDWADDSDVWCGL